MPIDAIRVGGWGSEKFMPEVRELSTTAVSTALPVIGVSAKA
jgi:hypothetical protein